MWPSAACTTVPGTASTAATASDVANDCLMESRSTTTKSGARRNPPPFASRPDSAPTVTATTTIRVRYPSGSASDLVRIPGPEEEAEPETGQHHLGRGDEDVAPDPAGRVRAGGRRGHPDRRAPREDVPVDEAGAPVGVRRGERRRDRRRERRREGDDRRHSHQREQRGGERGSALAEEPAEEPDYCADQRDREEGLGAHRAPRRDGGRTLASTAPWDPVGFNRVKADFLIMLIGWSDGTPADRVRGRRGGPRRVHPGRPGPPRDAARALGGRRPPRGRARCHPLRPGRTGGRPLVGRRRVPRAGPADPPRPGRARHLGRGGGRPRRRAPRPRRAADPGRRPARVARRHVPARAPPGHGAHRAARGRGRGHRPRAAAVRPRWRSRACPRASPGSSPSSSRCRSSR